MKICKWGFHFCFWECQDDEDVIEAGTEEKKNVRRKVFFCIYIRIYCVKKVGYGIGPSQSMVADVHLLCFYCIIKFLSKLHLVFVVDFCSHTFVQFLLMIHTICFGRS